MKTKTFETSTIDKLFLELSQFTAAKTAREHELEKENERLRESNLLLDKAWPIVDEVLKTGPHAEKLENLVRVFNEN